MNMNVSKTNTGKLLAAVLVMAMVFAGAAVMLSDESTAATTEIGHLSGDIKANQTIESGAVYVIENDLTMLNGAILTIEDGASFTVNEGVTVTINGLNAAGNKAGIVIGAGADVDINGTLVIGTNGTAAMAEDDADVNNCEKPGFDISGTMNVTNGGSFDLKDQNIYVNNGGTLNVTCLGAMVSTIGNGTVNLAPGATFNMRGAVYTTADSTLDVKSYEAADANANVVELNAAVKLTGTGDTSGATSANVSSLVFTSSVDNTTAYQSDVRKTVKTYNLDVSGTLQNGDKIEITGSKEQTLKDSNASTAKDVSFKDKVIVSGTFTIRNGEIDIGENGYFHVSGTTSVIKSSTTTATVFKFTKENGVIEVTGTTSMDYTSLPEDWNDLKDNAAGYMLINGGTVTIFNAGSNVPPLNGLYGAYYDVPNATAGTDLVVSDLEAAVKAAEANTEILMVTVCNAYGGSEDDYYQVKESFELPDNFTLMVAGYVTIPEGVTVTVGVQSLLDFASSTDGYVKVEGKLIDMTYSLSYNATTLKNTIVSDVVVDDAENATRTFTSLTIAIEESTPGDEITLCRAITIDDNLTIPEDITVIAYNGTDAIVIKDGAAVTINGILELGDNSTVNVSMKGSEADGSIVLNNVIANATDSKITNYLIPGAYFTGTIGDYTNEEFITSVEVAASASSTVTTSNNGIVIKGENVSFGDVTFTEGENNNQLYIDVQAEKATAGTITLVGADFQLSNPVAQFTGTVTAETTDGTVTVQLSKATGFDFIVDSANDGTTTTTSVKISGDDGVVYNTSSISGETSSPIFKGDMTVTAGTATLDSLLAIDAKSSISVADGASMVIGKNGKLYAGSEFKSTVFTDLSKYPYDLNKIFEEYASLVVDGTLTVQGTIAWGPVVVNGTMNVEKDSTTTGLDAVAVNGTLDVKEDAVLNSKIVVANGAINGDVEVAAALFAFAGSSMDAAIINNDEGVTGAKYTTFYANGVEYVTIYTADIDMPIEVFAVFADVPGTVAGSAAFYTDVGEDDLIIDLGTTEYANFQVQVQNYFDNLLNSDKNDVKLSGVVIGDNENIYVDLDASSVKGTISQGTGLALYIDNINYDMYGGKLTVGSHTVRIDVKAGYDGANATITFNGQTVENGGTIEITSDMKDFTLVASGAVPATSVSDGSSDGMGLTEILLVILVILIVVMAIMVALRLMRS